MDEDNNAIGAKVLIQDLATGSADNPGHPFGHFVITEKAKPLSGSLLFKTCPHVL